MKKGREEVEELLQAAQDEALLNLTIHSHLPSTHSPSNYLLHPDLHRRFQSLKSKPKSSLSSSSAATAAAPVAGEDKDQDLLARFQALKASISTSASDPTTSHGPPPPSLRHHPSDDDDDDDDDEVNEDDEVDKVIQWAVDAARLDPSPLAGDDDDSEEEEDDEEEEKVAGESPKETKKHR